MFSQDMVFRTGRANLVSKLTIMNKTIFTILLIVFTAWNADAKIWRVNNTPGVAADFKDLQDGIDAASAGDTIYLEGSTAWYNLTTLTKKLTIIGTGYFLSGQFNNPGLQADGNSAIIGLLYIDSSASGSLLMGLIINDLRTKNVDQTRTDNVTIKRCKINTLIMTYPDEPAVLEGWKLEQCYLIDVKIWPIARNWTIRNNIFIYGFIMVHSGNFGNIVRNNVIANRVELANCYFANNILKSNYVDLTNMIVKNNLAIGYPSGFAYYAGTDGNSAGYTHDQIFQGASAGSYDGQYVLAAGSPAVGAGLTVGSVTSPDAGAFGGPDPYRLSGIPPIPTFFSASIPTLIAPGSATVSITISARNNN